MTPLVLKEVRDAVEIVRAMHELASRTAVPMLTAGHLEAMRAANGCFEARAYACSGPSSN